MEYAMATNSRYQQGFTLIELMISLVLGLLISAAVIQVFITSQRVDRVQTAGSEIQDSAVFGLQAIEQQLRLANLGNDGVPINDMTRLGGIVMTAGTAGSVNMITTNGLESGFLTRSQDMDSDGPANKWNGALSNTNVNSDQLTIQYVNTTGRELQDCEGESIAINEHVVTRYFVTQSDTATGKTRENIDLNCEAGRIASDGTLSSFRGAGVTVIHNVDQFNIRLGVKERVVTAGTESYEYTEMTVKDYMALADKPFITNVKITILARSSANSPDDSASDFMIFGDTQTLKTQANAPRYLRRVYQTNTLLRNARIVDIIDRI